jgi:hypothetical protein
MPDDDEFDGMLLVETLLRPPYFPIYALSSSGANVLDYIGLGLTIVSVFVIALILLAPYASSDSKFRALGVVLAAGQWIWWLLAVTTLLYPIYKVWDAADTAKIRQHIFTNEGIQLQRSEDSALLPWSSISRAVETPKDFLFYQGSRTAAFVPRSCLQGEAEINIIRKFAAKYVATAKLLA